MRRGRPGPARRRRRSSAGPRDPRGQFRGSHRPGNDAPPVAGRCPTHRRPRADARAPARSYGRGSQLCVQHAGGCRGIDCAAAADVIVGSGDDRAHPEQAKQPVELPRDQPPLLHQVIRGGEEIDGAQVRIRRLIPHRHRTAREPREDRVERSSPRVVAEDLSREHERPGVHGKRAIKLVAGLRPGGWDPLPLELFVDRLPAHERERGEDEQRDQDGRHAGRRGDPQPSDPQSPQPHHEPCHPQTKQPGDAGRDERRGLVRCAHEAQHEDMAVHPRHAAPERRAVGESGHHDHDSDDHQSQQQRRIAISASDTNPATAMAGSRSPAPTTRGLNSSVPLSEKNGRTESNPTPMYDVQ